MKRNNCEICGYNKLQEIYCLKNMPVKIGVSEQNKIFDYSDMIFMQCEYCKNVQLYDLVAPEIVYSVNHNVSVVGKIWQEHNISFSQFILKQINTECDIFEIGDPVAKIASLIIENEKIKSWDIIEPNYNEIQIEKINFIAGYFDENFSTDKQYDFIVLSHVFEHFVNYDSIINKMSNVLKENSKIIISVPNMQKILDSKILPLFNMHFEHTVFLNKTNIIEIMKKNNFSLEDYLEYKDHSEFYIFKKDNDLEFNFKELMKIDFVRQIKETIEPKIQKIVEFEQLVSEGNYDSFFIYGAHVQAQTFFTLGLDYKILNGALDNDKLKIGKYLYGFNIKIFPNEILNNYKKPLVLCDMGAYTLEIKEQLHKEYPHITII